MTNLIFSLLVPMAVSLSVSAGEFNFNINKSILSEKAESISALLNINGKQQKCVVDTGARITVAKTFILADLVKAGEVLGGGISNTQINTDLVKTDMALGDWNINGAIVGRTDRIPYDCLIGNDFFISRVFETDFNQNKFSEIESFKDDSNILDVFESETGGHFGFELEVASQKIKSIFDTGASETVIDKSIVEQNPQDFQLIKELNVTDGNNASVKAGLYRVKQIKFADVEFKNIEVYVLDLSSLKSKLSMVNAVLGLNIIQNFNWSFDMHTKSWKYLRN